MSSIIFIGGCGRVGLPLAAWLSSENHEVQIFDVDKEAIHLLNQKISPFREEGLSELLLNNSFKKVSHELKNITPADFVFVTIPIESNVDRATQQIENIFRQLEAFNLNCASFVIRSTIPIGTCKKIKEIYPDINFTYAPERMSAGQTLVELKKFPQLLASSNDSEYKKTQDLFTSLNLKIEKLTLEEAEVAKILCNAWRYSEFALANHFYTICSESGFDFNKILKSIKKEYPRADRFPEAGPVGGPCLKKDFQILNAWKPSKLHEKILEINESFSEKLVLQLESKVGELRLKKIAILGDAFKIDTDDKRQTAAINIQNELTKKQAFSEIISYEKFMKIESQNQFDGFILHTKKPADVKLKTTKPIVCSWSFEP